MAKLTNAEIIESLKEMTILELNELVKAIEADSNQILTIGLEYSNLYKKNGKVDVSKIEKVKKKIHAAILSGNRYVKKNMTDVEKAMVLHDYLIRKVNYSNDGVETVCEVYRYSFQAGKRCCFVALRNWKGPYRDRDCFKSEAKRS